MFKRLIFIVISLFFSFPVRADIIYLKTGAEIKGTIIEITDKAITLRFPSGGTTSLQREMIERIEDSAVENAERVITEVEKLQKEAVEAIETENYGIGIKKYKVAIVKCNSVRKLAGDLYERAKKLSIEFEEQITSIKSTLKEKGLVEYKENYVSADERGELVKEEKIDKVVARITSLRQKALQAVRVGNNDKALKMYSSIFKQIKAISQIIPNVEKIDKLKKDALKEVLKIALEDGDAEFQKKRYENALVRYNVVIQISPKNTIALEKINKIKNIKARSFIAEGIKMEKEAVEYCKTERYIPAVVKYERAAERYGLVDKDLKNVYSDAQNRLKVLQEKLNFIEKKTKEMGEDYEYIKSCLFVEKAYQEALDDFKQDPKYKPLVKKLTKLINQYPSYPYAGDVYYFMATTIMTAQFQSEEYKRHFELFDKVAVVFPPPHIVREYVKLSYKLIELNQVQILYHTMALTAYNKLGAKSHMDLEKTREYCNSHINFLESSVKSQESTIRSITSY